MTNTERNFDVIDVGNGAFVKAWTRGVLFEDQARAQVLNIARMPFVHRSIAVMPDVHAGKGATVGSVIPTVGAVIPAAVGVDIGCGMMAVKTSLRADQLPDTLAPLRSAIERAVPHGRTDNGGRNDRGAWRDVPGHVAQRWDGLAAEFAQIAQAHPTIAKSKQAVHLGTLGTGNHFIEVCLDEADGVWIMLHSGSRGVGNRIGSYFIELAKKDMRRWFINLPDMDLAYLPEGTDNFNDYVRAVDWAQRFAMTNREVMMEQVLAAMRHVMEVPFDASVMAVNCHHNYIERERYDDANVWLTRKGAVSARAGQLGIIPGSMGARSYIVRGKGSVDSFNSCSHGAGRMMSRTEARRRFTVEDHVAATRGIECRKDPDVIDETPMAYKSIDAVMEAQRDLVEVVHTLRQVVCVKG